MKAVMIRTRFEENLHLVWRSTQMLIACILTSVIAPLFFTLMIHMFNTIDIFRDIASSMIKSDIIPLLWIVSLLMISFAIISSVHLYKQGLARYDEDANKEYTEKDLNEWCYCSFDKPQHKIKTHINDPKFFIQ